MLSIILPTYNSYKFIEPRVKSILEQEYNNWECIVIDGNSTDGTWEYLSAIASTDNRFHLYQYPPKGVYDAWNKGIEFSKGTYIYFATSDDTMVKDCLSKLHEALIENPECKIAHCCLSIIDENNNKSHELDWLKFDAQQYYGENILKKHIRYAPLDGLLYCTHNTVFHSFTQLLIKKEIFDEIGLFLTNYGPTADFEWGMRATLRYNTVHIPEFLATWRFYKGQATTLSHFNSLQNKKVLIKFIGMAGSGCLKKIPLYKLKAFYYKQYLKRLGRKKRYLNIKHLILLAFISLKSKHFISNTSYLNYLTKHLPQKDPRSYIKIIK